MALVTAQQLLTRAESGEVLNAQDRRHVLQYLQAMQPGLTGQQLADMFKVSPRMIRTDKLFIREEKARFLKDEMTKDLSLVVADIAMDFEKQVLDLERSKHKCKLGTKQYVDHCTSIFNLRIKMIQTYQDIGYLPKNLGAMTVEKFEYKAVVHKDGSVNTRSVEMFDEKDSATRREAFDAEFTDVPQLTNGEQSSTSTPESETVEIDGAAQAEESSPSIVGITASAS